MRLGLVTPVLTMLPGAHAKWEEDAGWDDVVEIARAADDLGYHHLTCSEHVAVPTRAARVRGGRYWDPLATFGYLAAVTQQIRLATLVLVLGYHHPLAIAKRYGTLDVVTGGRLILGVGVGSLREEFDLLGAPFEDRGRRADDALRALRGSFGVDRPAHHGPHYDYDDLIVDPSALQPRVPIWIGGHTARSLRRAVELGDGWAPFAVPIDDVRAMLDRAEAPPELEVVLQPPRPIDPLGDPEGSAAVLGSMREAGATHAALHFTHHSRSHYVEQLHAARELQP